MVTAENVRFHAAGHIAAAYSLAAGGHIESARHVLKIVRQYVDSPSVQSPPPLREKLDASIADPGGSIKDMVLLEQWFCDDANTGLEKNDVQIGNG